MELCCYFSKDKEFTAADVAANAAGNGSNVSDDMLDNIFDFLGSRKYLFSNAWPFQIKHGPSRIVLKATLTVRQQFYMALLLSSNPTLFKKKFHHFTSAFEHISETLLKTYLPADSKTFQMGAGNTMAKKINSKPLSPLDRMRFISEQTRIDISNKISTDKRKSGDFAIDMVGWKKYNKYNKAPGTIAMLGQCTCGREWPEKQYKITRSALSKLFNINESIVPAMTIPHSIRSTDGNWEHPLDVCPIIMLDRLSFINELPENIIKTLYRKFYNTKLNEIARFGRVSF